MSAPRPPVAPAVVPPPVPPSPQQLYAAVLRDLSRPVPGSPGAGVVLTLLMAVPTFGLLPAVLWPFRWAAFVAGERRQYAFLADWVAQATGHPDARRLARRVAALRAQPILSALAMGCCVGLCALFAAAFVPLGPDAPFECTYQYLAGARHGEWLPPGGPTNLHQVVYFAWVGLLTVAYACHWLQVHLHARKVRCVLDEFNKVVIHDALSPVFLQPIGFGLRPLFLLGAILVVGALSAPWGIALMLAAAVQRRYTRCAAPAMRAALSARLRDMMLLRRPAYVSVITKPAAPPAWRVPSRLRCPTAGCRLSLPAGARYCPRCGSRVAAPLDRVA